MVYLEEAGIAIANFYEDAESKALWNRAQLDPVLRNYLYHIPNGGRRNKREAGRMKAMGVRAGVHDYHLPVARGIYHSLYVELKAKAKGYYPKPTEGQLIWRQLVREAGNAAFIVKGWERAFEVMQAYLNLGENEGIYDFVDDYP